MDSTINYDLKKCTEHILLQRYEAKYRARLLDLHYDIEYIDESFKWIYREKSFLIYMNNQVLLSFVISG